MNMKFALRMKVSASTPDEAEKAEELNERARQICRASTRSVLLDDSLWEDLNRILADLYQLAARARARRRRRNRPPPGIAGEE